MNSAMFTRGTSRGTSLLCSGCIAEAMERVWEQRGCDVGEEQGNNVPALVYFSKHT